MPVKACKFESYFGHKFKYNIMKIISKYKDYYDYLQGIYGIDNKVVLDRTKGKVIDIKFNYSIYDYMCENKSNTYRSCRIDICGFRYEIAINGLGKPFVGRMLLTLPDYKLSRDKEIIYLKNNRFECEDRISIHINPTKTGINEEMKCPIIFNEEIIFPRLSDFNIQKVLPAKDIYYMLYTWIEAHSIEKIEDKRTNNEHIISAGFDLKSSFRNIK